MLNEEYVKNLSIPDGIKYECFVAQDVVDYNTIVRRCLMLLLNEPNLPRDFFRKVEFQIKVGGVWHFLYFKGMGDVSYSAEAGYDRILYTKHTTTDSNGKVSSYTTEKTVTDWKPFSGKYNANAHSYLTIGDFNMSEHYSSIVTLGTCVPYSENPDPTMQPLLFDDSARKSGESACISNAKFMAKEGINTGKKIKNFEASVFFNLVSISQYIVPVVDLSYRYSGKRYYVYDFATLRTPLSFKLSIPSSLEDNKTEVGKKTRMSKVFRILSLILGIGLITYTLLLLVFDIIFFVLSILTQIGFISRGLAEDLSINPWLFVLINWIALVLGVVIIMVSGKMYKARVGKIEHLIYKRNMLEKYRDVDKLCSKLGVSPISGDFIPKL